MTNKYNEYNDISYYFDKREMLMNALRTLDNNQFQENFDITFIGKEKSY